MNTTPISFRAAALCLAAALAAADAPASETTQSFQLQGGWNAICLTVNPEPDAVESVFEPLTSRGVLRGVWRINTDTPATQFVQNPSELLPSAKEWLCWFPAGPGRIVLQTLHAVHGGNCYLIELEPDAGTVPFTVTGRPVSRPLQWQEGRFSLVALPVDPDNPPSFATYFAHSAAHNPPEARRIDPASGRWTAVNTSDPIRPGEAYWVRANAASSYQGPASVEAEDRGMLDFGSAVLERPLILRNASSQAASFTLKNLSAMAGDTTAGPLALSVFDDWSGDGDPALFTWRELPSGGLSVPVDPGLRRRLRIAVRRNDMASEGTGTPFASLLEITSTLATRHLLGARADGFPGAGDPGRHAGLWVGHARIYQVEQVTEDQNTLKNTPSEASFRLIVHVDATGQARLLRECILMWINGTTDNQGTVLEPGRLIAFNDGAALDTWKTTHPALAERLTGVSERANGQLAGRRISSVAFSFDGPQAMGTGFGNGAPTTTLTIAPDDDLNPYRHRYHPDHQQGITITRVITLDFATPPGDAGGRPPDISTGDAELSGTYEETIDGLYRAGIDIKGEFRLRRIVGAVELAQ